MLSIRQLLAFTSILLQGAVAQAASISAIPSLPGNSSSVLESNAFGMSGDGRVVVGHSFSSNGLEAFIYKQGSTTGIGDLPGGTFNSIARAISEFEHVVGNGRDATDTHGFTFRNSVFSQLPSLPTGDDGSNAYDVSADGSRVVGAADYGFGGLYEAAFWEDAVLTSIGRLSGDRSIARAISGDESTIVESSDTSSGIKEAFVYQGSVLQGLGDLPGGTFHSTAHGVSALGDVIVGFGNSANGQEAMVHKGGVMTALPDLPGGSTFSSAYDVSFDGSVIVGFGRSGVSNEATIWRDNGSGTYVVSRLEDELLAAGIDIAADGWSTLFVAYAVSDDGNVFAGIGTRNGKQQGWRATIELDLDSDGLLFFPDQDDDGDGIPSLVELTNPPLNSGDAADAAGDLDGDGWSNLDEYRFGTDMNDISDDPGAISGPTHQKIFAADGGVLDEFGEGIAIDGDTALVGTRRHDSPFQDTGGAYVFVRGGDGIWEQQAKLSPSDGAVGDFFGFNVAISGDTAAIGAYFKDGAFADSGAVYVFERQGTEWSQTEILLPSDPVLDGRFGVELDIDGDRIAIGAARADSPIASASGAVYIFERFGGSWTQEDKIWALDAQSGDEFGTVVLEGDVLLVGARWSDEVGSNSGAAYIFRKNGSSWPQEAKLVPSLSGTEDRFGQYVALEGDTAFVSAYRNDANGPDSGAVFVFERNGTTWPEAQVINPSTAGDEFGLEIDVSNDVVAIGSRFDGDAASNAGAAYLYERTESGWMMLEKLFAQDAQAGDQLGIGMGLDGDTLLVGSPGDDDLTADAGAAYIFDLSGNGTTVPLPPWLLPTLGLALAASGSRVRTWHLARGASAVDRIGHAR